MGKGEWLVIVISRSYNIPTWRSFRYSREFEMEIIDLQVEKWMGRTRSVDIGSAVWVEQ